VPLQVRLDHLITLSACSQLGQSLQRRARPILG
jgi:hypothetical protein